MPKTLENKNDCREAALHCCGFVGISGCKTGAGLVCSGSRGGYLFVCCLLGIRFWFGLVSLPFPTFKIKRKDSLLKIFVKSSRLYKKM